MKAAEWSEADGREVATWHYEPPYGFYGLAWDSAAAAETGDDDRLDAFWYFDRHGDVVELAIGLRPDLTGAGLGDSHLRAQLDSGSQSLHPQRFRLRVASWNRAA